MGHTVRRAGNGDREVIGIACTAPCACIVGHRYIVIGR